MNYEIIQKLRYKLQKRVRRLNSIEVPQLYHSYLKQFWVFLHESPIFSGILDDLSKRIPEAEKLANDIVLKKETISFNIELELVATCYYVIDICVKSKSNDIEMKIGFIYKKAGPFAKNLEFFHHYFVETLYDYIDENLDDQKLLLALLRRYKQRCEWFRRDSLLKMYNENTQIGEKSLAMDLYEYLFDQGIEFSIEPSSASGKPDLIAAQNTDDPLIADAKIFDPQKSKNIAYITKGFNQIYQYTMDYNEPFGYLVIFKICEEDLKLDFKEKERAIPFVIYNNKTIFFIVIDICKYEKSASQRGKLKVCDLREDELIKIIKTKE